MHCPMDGASHTWPLMSLLGAQGDRVGQHWTKSQRLFFAVPRSFVGPNQQQPANEPLNLFGQPWGAPYDIYDQQGLLSARGHDQVGYQYEIFYDKQGFSGLQ